MFPPVAATLLDSQIEGPRDLVERGVFAFGLGTALESSITLFGNTVWLNKRWYIAGAILGAYPLAQGTVFCF